MAVIRVNKTADYTVMSNAHFKEKNMSLKAKGLLSLMLSLPNTWDYSIAGLCAICVEKESAIKSTLDELKEFGYLRVTKKYPNETESGRIEYIYDIFETPQNQELEKQEEVKQGAENLCLEHQGVENQGQSNTNKSNTNKSNTKELKTKEDISTEFETLWKMYPRKLGKPKALKAYTKARKSGVTFEQVKEGIENYLKQIKAQNTGMEFIKHGSTWFGNECWNDEYDTTNKGDTNNGTDYANSSSEPPAWSGKWY